MDKYLDIYFLPKLNQEVMKNPSRSMSSKKIEALHRSMKKNPRMDGLIAEFCQIFNVELIPNFSNYSIKQKEKESFQTHSMKPIPKADKNILKKRKKENYDQFS
jgi:hypothetical protein